MYISARHSVLDLYQIYPLGIKDFTYRPLTQTCSLCTLSEGRLEPKLT